MDDLLYRVSSINQVQKTIQIVETSRIGNLPLIKRALDSKEILQYINQTHQIDASVEFEKADKDLKILGLHWWGLFSQKH